MSYPGITTQPADFRAIGYERRDEGTQPRVLVTRVDGPANYVGLHIAGEERMRVVLLEEVVENEDLMRDMDPLWSLRAGVEWHRLMCSRGAPEAALPASYPDCAVA